MKKLVTGTVVGVAIVGLGGLLAGFTPSPAPRFPEIRGRLPVSLSDSRLPLSSYESDVRILSGASSGRMTLDREPLSASAGVAAPASEQTLLHIGGQTVSFLTDDGPKTVSVSGGLMALLPLLPPGAAREDGFAGSGGGELLAAVLEVAAQTGEGELLASDGRPLRWAAPMPSEGGPTCARPLALPAPLISPAILEPGFHSMPMLARASRYQDIVERYARKYSLDPSLVMAIMQTESGFNPSLISTRQAHGLMQVVPSTAGDEVHRWMGRSGLPSADDLLNPDNNIRYGVAYLHLLRTKHLDGIENPLSLEFCVIAAYNGGSGAVLRHFGGSKEEAVAVINNMDPQEVLARLVNDFPARETRLFVGKVLATRAQFVAHAARPGKAVAQASASAPGASSGSRVSGRAAMALSGEGGETVSETDVRAQLRQLESRLAARQQARERRAEEAAART